MVVRGLLPLVVRRGHVGEAMSQTVTDLEDIGRELEVEPRSVYRSALVIRKSRKAKEASGWLPESKLVYVRTFGCAHNASDSEYMAGVLSSEGYGVTMASSDAAKADAWVINSCTVKDPSESSFFKAVREGRKLGKGVVVAGCVPQAQRSLKIEGASVIGVKQIGRVGEAVAASLRGEEFVATNARGALPELELPKVRRNELVEIIPLSTGCLGSCTYCKTRHARGKLGSYPLEDIERRFVGALEDGVAEIWLSSEDTGAYGRDLGTSLAELLARLVARLRDFPRTRLRLGMTNPPFILAQLDELARILASPQVYAFIHLPVQSGSDAVLSQMRREYTISEFRQVADRLQAQVQDVTIATDIICGFPGETDDDFEATLALVADYEFAVCNISQFYARPGTPAAAMRPRVPTDVVKARSRKLTKVVAAFRPYDRLVGRTLRCAARDELADDGARLVAHTKAYVKVLVPFDPSLVGAHFDVVVTAAHRWHVDATVLDVILDANAATRPALRAALARLRPSSSSSRLRGREAAQAGQQPNKLRSSTRRILLGCGRRSDLLCYLRRIVVLLLLSTACFLVVASTRRTRLLFFFIY